MALGNYLLSKLLRHQKRFQYNRRIHIFIYNYIYIYLVKSSEGRGNYSTAILCKPHMYSERRSKTSMIILINILSNFKITINDTVIQFR